LTLDPHAKVGERAYDVETLYFDTAAF
jgi:hypothetical protein